MRVGARSAERAHSRNQAFACLMQECLEFADYSFEEHFGADKAKSTAPLALGLAWTHNLRLFFSYSTASVCEEPALP